MRARASIGEPCDNFGPDAECLDGFVTNDEAMGARQRFQHRRFIPRLQAAKIEHLGIGTHPDAAEGALTPILEIEADVHALARVIEV